MAMNPSDIKRRWDTIRMKPECDLSLDPASVAQYLSVPESKLVRERIRESLSQLASYRTEKGGFVSWQPAGPGDLATCEGLEAFLIPAVEGALSFSDFLDGLHPTARLGFVANLKNDIQILLANWETGKFSAGPYASTIVYKEAISQKDVKENITEAAAMACRVLIHLLTLKLNRSDEAAFQREIGVHLDDARLFRALENAIDFLIRAFQKGQGKDEEMKIVSASVGDSPGSGWSWTAWDGLPPMLFFTAAAVDAFAELDLYLIRAVTGRDANGESAQKLAAYYYANKTVLERFQLCIEMARRWVSTSILPVLSSGYGQYAEVFPDEQGLLKKELSYNKSPDGYEHFENELARYEGLQHPPMIFFNNLYALLILLWSWGDRNAEGTGPDEDAQSRINRALAQLVYNYGSIPVVKQILNKFPYQFYLPGPGIFRRGEEEKCEYMDSGFLPLLARLLVLFVMYGVADRKLLEPVTRDLYLELLQNRNRVDAGYPALWSADGIEIFSTARAIQALTFYYAYARGQELVEGRSDIGGELVLRNKTGLPLAMEIVATGSPEQSYRISSASSPFDVKQDGTGSRTIKAKDFKEYCRQISAKPGPVSTNAAEKLQNEAVSLGQKVVADLNSRTIRDHGAAKVILESLAKIVVAPEAPGRHRGAEFSLLAEQYDDLVARSSSDE